MLLGTNSQTGSDSQSHREALNVPHLAGTLGPGLPELLDLVMTAHHTILISSFIV